MKEYMNLEYYGFGKVACSFSEHPTLSGDIVYLSLKGIRVILCRDSVPVLRIGQGGLWSAIKFLPVKVLLCFPNTIPPYHVYDQHDHEIGKSIHIFNRRTRTFMMQGSTYVLCQHSFNMGSLTKNNAPFARFVLDQKSNQVQIDYAESSAHTIILAFALLFYAVFHANESWRHTSIFFRDNYSEVLEWNFEK